MVMLELVVVDPAALVDTSVLEVLLPLLHAVSTAAAASSAALVIVSDRFL
jgi:hypothetical protein